MRILHFFLALLFIPVFIDSYEPELWSESAIAIDFETEQILYKKKIDMEVAPASMTKIVNLFMVYEALEEGTVSKKDFVDISKRADYKSLPRDSSLMFIEEGQKVTLHELMFGLSISSGNDAAIAIAEFIYGSLDTYLIAVNNKLTEMGFKKMLFVDASGYSDNNVITVREFAEFCLYFIKKHPESLEDVFNIKSFSYPAKRNGYSTIGPITQFNHNKLVDIYPGLDGLKTGFIDKSGMNITVTAKNNSRRVIAVLSGVRDFKKSEAELKRFYDATTLLHYSLNNFRNVTLSHLKLPEIRVNGGYFRKTQLIIPYNRVFTISDRAKIRYTINKIDAPMSYLTPISEVIISQSGFTYIFPAYTSEEIFLNN